MKKQLLSFILMLMLAGGLASGCSKSSIANNSSVNNEEVTGGNCQYKDYEGVVTIKEIQRPSNANAAPGNSQEKLSVSYSFKAEGYAPESVRLISGKMELTQEEIDRKSIKTGKQFRTKASYIERGTCNPGPYLDDFEKWQ